MKQIIRHPVAVIGAGPVGLAAAAHLALRSEPFLVLEAGPSVGHAMAQWAHVRVFSPWRFNIDRAARQLLEAADWQAPDPEAMPTGGELLARYLKPLAAHPALARGIRLNTRVSAVTRQGMDKVKSTGREERPFALRLSDGETLLARAVIDASGTWFQPNPIGADGLPVPGEAEQAAHIAYGIPDVLGHERARYAGKRVLVIGSGHSAFNVLLDLAALPDTRVHWAMRRSEPGNVFGGGANDALPARGALGAEARRAVQSGRVELLAPFRVQAIKPGLTVEAEHDGEDIALSVDEIVVATGFRPDLAMNREVRVTADPWLEAVPALAPLIDPNLHSCGTVRPHGAKELAQPEADYYVLGMKSYGRAPTFLMATGYEQARSVVAALVGDHAAAARVELELPQTGVCTGPAITLLAVESAAAGCCGGPAPAEADACCVADATAKAAGADGCGCGPAEPAKAPATAAKGCCG